MARPKVNKAPDEVGRPFKRQKTSNEKQSQKSKPFVTDIPIKLQVSEDDGVYIHKSRLSKQSKWFEREAARRDVIELDNVGPEVLQSFATWVYDGKIDVEELAAEVEKGDTTSHGTDDNDCGVSTENAIRIDEESDGGGSAISVLKNPPAEAVASPPSTPITIDDDEPWYLNSDLNARNRVFGRLLDLYYFGVTYEVQPFTLATIRAWQRFSRTTATYPCATVVRHVVSKLGLSSLLTKYLIGCYAHYVDAEDIDKQRCATIQPGFLVEVWVETRERGSGFGPDHDWCAYHGHETEEEGNKCRSISHGRSMLRPWSGFRGCC